MVTSIKKRDARIVPFDVNKIAQAIFRAASSQGGKDYVLSLKIAAEVLERLNEQFTDDIPDVEQVQDLVEKTLIKSGHARTAKAYILYRHQRTKVREMNTRLMTTIRDLTFKDAKDNDLKRENANIDGDTAMGTMLKYGSESSKQFYEMYILNPKHSLAHKNGDIHIHDLDFLTLTTTCCQIDIKKLFRGGFGTGTASCASPTTSAATARWPASLFRPIRTISTAARASRILNTAWPSAWPRPSSRNSMSSLICATRRKRMR